MKIPLTALIASLVCGFSLGVAQAGDTMSFEATLSGAQEPVTDNRGNFIPGGIDTAGTGKIRVYFDEGLTKVWVAVWFNNLTGSFTAAHFHCGVPGQSGPPPFGLVAPGPLMSDGRTVRGTLVGTDFTGVDCTSFVGRPVNNIAALAWAMREGLIYINVHSDAFPAGEIRGQLQETGRDWQPPR